MTVFQRQATLLTQKTHDPYGSKYAHYSGRLSKLIKYLMNSHSLTSWLSSLAHGIKSTSLRKK